jgi:hypothetical protein
MTPMSESRDQPTLGNEAKAARLLALSSVARRVHDSSVLVLISMMLLGGGCIIPPSLAVDNQDAGVNSPPSILAVRAADKVLGEADPMNSANFVFDEDGAVSISLLDTDVLDTLYVRIFVDYTAATPEGPRAQCTAAPNESTRRTVSCDVKSVCFMRDVNQTRNMTVVVFDRMPLESGDPPHQAMPEGGLSASKFFFLNCNP